MVTEERVIQKSWSFNFRKMFELPGRKLSVHGLDGEEGRSGSPVENQSTSGISKAWEKVPISRLGKSSNQKEKEWEEKEKERDRDMQMMREKFSKLLLGEDMSGGGKGVPSALALSNAITNLAASVFGEQSKLEPMSAERKARWRKEIGWLLSVTDYIVELVPSQQKAKDGSTFEIMMSQQRRDLLMNTPALKKLDAMLIDCLDEFSDQNEFWYVSKDADESERGVQKSEKWWLPTVKVPPGGLSDSARKCLLYQKECVIQVLKASMAINAHILSEMEIPESYIEALPKNGRASLGDSLYKSITLEYFDPHQFLSMVDLSTEHSVLDLKNRIEASIVIWKRKMNQKDGKSSWGVSLEKREQFEERAETILILLKHRFPGLPQSSLDISKIQFNRDVGYAILECYSRVLESLANTVMSRIEDVLYADSLAQAPPLAAVKRKPPSPPASIGTGSPVDETDNIDTPNSMTLSDFMGWNFEPGPGGPGAGEPGIHSKDNLDVSNKPTSVTPKKFSYLEQIETGQRSPTARH
ncbi:PREDICTED: rho guanine nucleotide exchange factor 8-like [Ipomoea nil]|uniref:rho guanine nucleotide exchange factor 8-like n=1 Tax=Ipomoea nil TaxID=35883 RepID=UPI000901484F|nr:PREDICTED: rho guanine nucleotide exchange factor 8-like [Ipomoea nil]